MSEESTSLHEFSDQIDPIAVVLGLWISLDEYSMIVQDLAELRGYIADARIVIDRGIDLMSNEQLGQWSGVRTWLESAPEAADDHA